MINRRYFVGALSALTAAVGWQLPESHGLPVASAERDFGLTPGQNRAIASRAPRVAIIGGNRAGTTITAATILAREALWVDEPRRPKPKSIAIIGYDMQAIGSTIYRMLFKEVIAGNPGPLLSGNRILVENRVWENKKNHVLQSADIRVDNVLCSHMYFYSSKALFQPNGFPFDSIWICDGLYDSENSERIYNDICERQAESGRVLWSSWPHPEYAWIADRKDITKFHLSMLDNPRLSKESLEQCCSTLSPKEIEQRVYGRFVKN